LVFWLIDKYGAGVPRPKSQRSLGEIMLLEIGLPPLMAMTFAAVLGLSLLELRRNQQARKHATASALARRQQRRTR
jgi:hypothetical protein